MARKLEFLMADVIARSSDVVITQGAIQSNHALQTAAIASKLDMKCVLALKENNAESKDPRYFEFDAVLLDRLYGAEIHRFPDGSDMEAATRELADQYATLGHRPYVIPRGGSNPVGALGYVNCAFEIASQLREQGLRIDCIIHSTDSGGTQAGLIVGLQLAGMNIPVVGMGVDTPGPDQKEKVYDLVRRTSEYLGLEQIPLKSDVVVNSNYIGDGNDTPAAETLNAVATIARYESILIEPGNSGIAMEGLMDLIANKHQFAKDQNILFLHTGGNLGLFDHVTPIAQFLASETRQ